jgi:hypothetical protein
MRSSGFRHRATQALVLMFLAAAIGPLASPRDASAQNAATISVTAVITSVLSISVCDTTANFGNGLNALGATPTQTSDQISHSARGDSSLGQGTIYIWTPSCAVGEWPLKFESTVPFQVQFCATENTGTSSLSVASGDLGLAYGFTGTPTYDAANSTVKFRTSSCRDFGGGSAGSGSSVLKFTLRVDLADSAGDFSAATSFVISA